MKRRPESIHVEFRSGATKAGASFSGIASVYDKLVTGARVPCVVARGAFSKTLAETDGTVPLLMEHDRNRVVGRARISDSREGLLCDGYFADTPEAAHAKSLLTPIDGLGRAAVDGLSIGFDVLKADSRPFVRERHAAILPSPDYPAPAMVRWFTEGRLDELSIVVLPAAKGAVVTEVHAAMPFEDLDLASDDVPESMIAQERVWEWSKGDYDQYGRAFLYRDDSYGAGEPRWAYRFQFADVIEGNLVAVPRMVMRCAMLVHMGRFYSQPSMDELDAIRDTVERYYAKMGRTTPWSRSKAAAGVTPEVEAEEESALVAVEALASLPASERAAKASQHVATLKSFLPVEEPVEASEAEATPDTGDTEGDVAAELAALEVVALESGVY